MKNGFLFIVFFLLGHCCLTAQSSQCGFDFSESQLKHFLSNKKGKEAFKNRSQETVYIPVKFHTVADVEGEGRVRFENVLDQLCAINENFQDLGFRFYLKDGTVNEVNDNTIYNNPSSAAGTTKMAGVKSQFGKNALNIFVTDNAGQGTNGLGTTLGYYDFNQDLVVLKKSTLANNVQVRFVLGHELGHFFSLPHTFNGWDAEPWDGEPVTSNFSPGGVLNELADSSNCENAGDMICDTPADYNLGFGWDGCREYDGGCMDPNGELLDPDQSNFMGYFLGCDDYFFSEEQKSIIESDYFSPRRAYLRTSFRPADEEIEPVAKAVSPADDSTTPFFNGVHMEWEPSENATHYLVELTQALFKFYYVTEQPSLFLTDLKADKNYRWKVKAFSVLNTCTDYSSSFSFETGDLSSSIDEEKVMDLEVNVFPNPFDGNFLNIELKNSLKNEHYIELYDINGRILSSGYYTQNIIKLENLDLRTGLYLLNIKNENGIVTKKIVVE
ncbi:zinc-dependent metalloprotease [Portibacter marinus]|uniref:zinc-dependent metalloprotease n=1 Tax=Portibacter marinus TaxID=2898660 RepID=UPI001F2E3E6E|nr:zinc-dependent metalloprotease [Portibacter marinus]